ncbi:hypothetical protein M422DRAFT_84943, partial [Sphaerobolus stellatus SS14]
QEPPPQGTLRGWIRMAVMDGKTLGHRICAMPGCRGPLMDYKQGRFCSDHIEESKICGIDNCQNPVSVGHTFRARKIYCLQTIQWACGVPIAFTKCYGSKSTPQVFKFLTEVWAESDTKPSFISYDNACNLLRHITRSHVESSWITSTRFIVDAWHYINHQATDLLCRTRCNPSPANGSQPDLLKILEHPKTGKKYLVRAFNTEAAEQLNAWLDDFEAQLRQMTDFHFDFVVHVALLIYKEKREEEI